LIMYLPTRHHCRREKKWPVAAVNFTFTCLSFQCPVSGGHQTEREKSKSSFQRQNVR
jgi:hypothetical protein